MGLDPNDLRLNIEANVSAPGAQQAAEQLRAAGAAADDTRARFERLQGASAGTRGVEFAPNAVNTPTAPSVQVAPPRVSVQPPPPPIVQQAIAAPSPSSQPVQPSPTPRANPFALLTQPGPGREPMSEQDVAQHLEDLGTRYAANVGRIQHLEDSLGGNTAKIDRPPWAVGLTNTAVEQIAKDHGTNAGKELWWEGVGLNTGSGEVRKAIGQGGYRGTGTTQPTPTQARDEMRRLIQENESLVSATELPEGASTLYRPPAPVTADLPWNAPHAQSTATISTPSIRPVAARADQGGTSPYPTDAQSGIGTPEPARGTTEAVVAAPRPVLVASAGGPPIIPPPRPPAPPAVPPAPAPEPDSGPVRGQEQAQQSTGRSISDTALATARAAGANETYLHGVRAIADALVTQNRAESDTQALRRAAIGLGTPQAEAQRLFPEQRGAVDQGRVRSALEGAGLNGRSDAESVRIAAEAERVSRIDQLRGGLVEAGLGPTQARREAARLVPPPTPVTVQTAEPAELTKKAVEGLDEPLQRAQRGASGLAGLFNLSGQSVTRAGLALGGVGAGLNALVTVASRVHAEIQAAVTAQEDLALRTRETVAEYGTQQSGQIHAQATAFTADPQTRGSEQDYLAAATSLHGLAAEYGLNTEQVGRLTTAAGTLARIHSTELAPAVQAVQGVLRGNVDAAQQYGISLTDEQGRIRGVGATYEQLVATVGRTRAEQILYQQVLQQTATQQANAAGPSNSTATALDRVSKAAEQARQNLAQLAEKPFNVAVNFLANLVSGFNQAAAPAPGQVEAEQRHPIGQATGTGVQAVAAAQPAPAAAPPATGPGGGLNFTPSIGAVPAIDAATAAQTGLAGSAKTVASAFETELSAFEKIGLHIQGDLIPILERLGATQQAISGIGAIEQALQGPDALTGGDLPRRASSQAAQDVLRQQRLRDAQQADPIITAAQQADPEEFARRQQAHLAEQQASEAQRFAGRAQVEAQAGVSTLNLVDQQRELDAAGELAGLRSQTLDREGHIVDLQRQEADLADRQRVASRENLGLLQAATQARLDGLQAANRLNDVQYAAQHDTTAIQAIRADVRRGAVDPSALQQIPELRQQVRAERLAEPRAQLQALEANRPAELAARPIAADELNRTLRSIPLQQEQRGLEDQLAPQQQAQRLTDERTTAINRQLELARLAEEPQRTAAERNLLAATAVQLAADSAVRSSEEWAANLHNGLTDLQRAWQAMGDIPKPPPIIGPQPVEAATAAPKPAQNPTPDRPSAPIDYPHLPVLAAQANHPLTPAQQARAAHAPAELSRETAAPIGVPAGQTAPTSTTHVETATYSITVQVTNPNASAPDIGRAVVAALNRRATRAPQATPRTMVGAR